jgi:SAM-dependent methyltransferase
LARAALLRWFDTPAGRALLAAERAVCRQLATAPGFRLVHLGVAPGHGVADCFGQHCRFSLAEVPGSGVDAVVSFDALPLPSDTVDVVVLHHVLDFAPYPHGVLVEAARTLRPGGRLILIGFNPYSLVGVRKWLLSPLRKTTVWRHNSLRRARLVDWLALLGFAVAPRSAGNRGCHARGATAYVIVATKRAVPLQPLSARPRMRSATLLGGYPAGRTRVVAKQRDR